MITRTEKQREVRMQALDALALQDPEAKCAAVWAMRETTNISVDARLDALDGIPGRPARPEPVAPASVPRRALSTVEGRAALLHALAHIAINAITQIGRASCRERECQSV